MKLSEIFETLHYDRETKKQYKVDTFPGVEHRGDEKKVIEEIKKHCQLALNHPSIIYKGITKQSLGPIFISDPPKGRRSANTKNYVTSYIDDVHPEWQKFPKRAAFIDYDVFREIQESL